MSARPNGQMFFVIMCNLPVKQTGASKKVVMWWFLLSLERKTLQIALDGQWKLYRSTSDFKVFGWFFGNP